MVLTSPARAGVVVPAIGRSCVARARVGQGVATGRGSDGDAGSGMVGGLGVAGCGGAGRGCTGESGSGIGTSGGAVVLSRAHCTRSIACVPHSLSDSSSCHCCMYDLLFFTCHRVSARRQPLTLSVTTATTPSCRTREHQGVGAARQSGTGLNFARRMPSHQDEAPRTDGAANRGEHATWKPYRHPSQYPLHPMSANGHNRRRQRSVTLCPILRIRRYRTLHRRPGHRHRWKSRRIGVDSSTLVATDVCRISAPLIDRCSLGQKSPSLRPARARGPRAGCPGSGRIAPASAIAAGRS
jgi:hypothetical protein